MSTQIEEVERWDLPEYFFIYQLPEYSEDVISRDLKQDLRSDFSSLKETQNNSGDNIKNKRKRRPPMKFESSSVEATDPLGSEGYSTVECTIDAELELGNQPHCQFRWDLQRDLSREFNSIEDSKETKDSVSCLKNKRKRRPPRKYEPSSMLTSLEVDSSLVETLKTDNHSLKVTEASLSVKSSSYKDMSPFSSPDRSTYMETTPTSSAESSSYKETTPTSSLESNSWGETTPTFLKTEMASPDQLGQVHCHGDQSEDYSKCEDKCSSGGKCNKKRSRRGSTNHQLRARNWVCSS